MTPAENPNPSDKGRKLSLFMKKAKIPPNPVEIPAMNVSKKAYIKLGSIAYLFKLTILTVNGNVKYNIIVIIII